MKKIKELKTFWQVDVPNPEIIYDSNVRLKQR